VSDHQYRIVTVNLYADETAWLDALCDRLRRRGLTKATRSEVVRLAITGLRRRLRDIGDQELVKVFLQELLEHAAHVDPENVTRTPSDGMVAEGERQQAARDRDDSCGKRWCRVRT